MSGMRRNRMRNDERGKNDERRKSDGRGNNYGCGNKISLQRVVQLLSAVVINGYAIGFANGNIFTGKSKAFCVPVLNCYSCPGALGACPIGALQAALGWGVSRFTCWAR